MEDGGQIPHMRARENWVEDLALFLVLCAVHRQEAWAGDHEREPEGQRYKTNTAEETHSRTLH